MSHDITQYVPAFWRPRFAGASEDGMLRFTPFLFWLFAALRPRQAAVLGIGDGTSCFAIGQAIERLQVGGTCVGIHFAGKTGPGIPEAVRDHAVEFYEGILDLRTAESPADMAWPEPGGLDLLVVDLEQAADWPPPVMDRLSSALSGGGCLVVHGLKHAPETEAMQHLHQLLSEQSGVSIDIGAGMTAACKNPDIFAGLTSPPTGALRPDVLSMFVRLGNGLAAERSHNALMSRLKKQQATTVEAQSRVERLEAETAELSAALDLRSRKASQFQAMYFDCRDELKKLGRIQTELVNAQADREKARDALAECDRLKTKLRERHETHYRETAALTVLLEEQRKSSTHEAETLRKQLEELRAQADALAQDNTALLSSTSWKITSPLRRISSKLRGHGFHR